MRPLRLEVNGFTAYRDPQQIDFTELDLFVITGPTGAGKTSLLDAITLCLYGRVPRMGGTGLGELVSHGKPEARVMLEFSVDGDRYRVSRRLPRKGSQSGKLERAKGNEWIDIVDRGGISPINKRLLELLKLDFDSFCKAIVLPQGEFARFLKGEPKERRETLTALLGLKVYERMGALARQRANELKIRGEQTRKILEEQFADATREALAAADEAVEDATVQAERAGELLARARELDRSRTHAALQSETAASLAGRLSAVSGELELEVGGCRAAEGVRERAEAARADAVNAAKAAGDAHASAQSLLAETRSRTGTPEDLGRMIDAVARREALENRVAETQELLDETTRARQNLAAGVERHSATSTDATQAAEQALEAEEAARSETERAGADRDEAERRWTSGQEASATAGAASSELSQAEELVAVAAQKAEAASHERSQAEDARATLHREHAAAALASGLVPGDPCPVCARPLVTLPPIEDEAARRLAEAGASYDRARQSAQAAQDELSRASGGVSAAQARMADAKRQLDSALDGLPDVEALEHQAARAREAADGAVAMLAQATATRRAADQTARDAALALTKAEAELAGAGREHDLRLQALDAALKDRDETLALLRGRFGADVPADAGAQLEAMRVDLDRAGHEEQAARAALDAAQAALRVADEAAGTAAAQLTELDMRLGELRSRAESTLENLDRLDAQLKLGEVPAPDAARDARASTLAEWCRTAATTLQDLSAELEMQSQEAAVELVALAAALESAPTDAPAALDALEQAERLAVSSRVRADETRMRLAARVAQREELEAGLTDDDKQIAVLSVLARELRADHFIEFVLQETLDLLADHATGELLRISDDRYSLVSENGEFSVVDHVNADERRSVKTLSGGETFMASLSLALALSKHVSELAGEGLGARLDAVFIDEGFGSLDPETLDEVIDALERLREDDLLIGVISHVPALAERISAGLRVSKDGNRSLVLPRT